MCHEHIGWMQTLESFMGFIIFSGSIFDLERAARDKTSSDGKGFYIPGIKSWEFCYNSVGSGEDSSTLFQQISNLIHYCSLTSSSSWLEARARGVKMNCCCSYSLVLINIHNVKLVIVKTIILPPLPLPPPRFESNTRTMRAGTAKSQPRTFWERKNQHCPLICKKISAVLMTESVPEKKDSKGVGVIDIVRTES